MLLSQSVIFEIDSAVVLPQAIQLFFHFRVAGFEEGELIVHSCYQ